VEPELSPGFDSDELHEVLTAAVRSLDMAGGSQSKPHIGTAVGAIINDHPPTDPDPADYLDDLMIFAEFFDQDLATDGPAFDVCVSAIQRFQNA
jgi:hypothetical protein